jgi:hypothetical protein
MKKCIVILVLILALVGCGQTINSIKMTPEQQAYVVQAMQQPIPISVTKDKSDETWGRILSFISQYASMKIRVATDYIIETFAPIGGPTPFYAYEAIRAVKGDTVEFNLRCYNDYGAREEECNRNVHLLAHYAVTGELIPNLIIR